MYWTFCLERGAPQRVNHASVAVGDKIYSFGGYCGELDMPIFIDVHCFDTNTLKWTKIHYEETMDCPQGCYGHSVVAYQHLIYLWGGQNVHGASNTLYCFNTKTLSWTRPVTSGRFPKPTDGHSACVIGDHMYTFGGFEEENDSYSQKVYSLDLITFRWQEVQTFGFLPCKRDFHTASVIGSCMYIFGGRSSEDEDEPEFYPCDIIYLDTNTMKWTTPVNEGSVPCGRRSHSAIVFNNEIYIFGGYDGNREQHMNDVYKYNPVTSVWTEMKVLGKPPHPRRRHCSVLVGDIVYLFGGSSPDERALHESRRVLREHCDMHMLEFAPSLKKLSLLKIMEHQISFNCLPVSLQSEIKWLTSLKLQPVYTYQKRNYTAFAP
ncbi:Kelch domain-containing protein 3 [Araneus ventricosus]|uniref:Kelch domain-containing protein 3 n=1 Tax=Araneus ventricosus TaxID=182803 RepID=A0A4Y2JXS2_ARAVE|nr:Kelch domain-containing protein 3 [Araneus ventricosus]